MKYFRLLADRVRNGLPLAALTLMPVLVSAQILDISPVFPTVDDSITVIYDATQGNAALTGVAPVYAHTGVITNQSTSPSDWKYVQGNWGTADPRVLMENLGNNRHKISYRIRSYYNNIPTNVNVLQLAYVFRNQAGTVVGRDPAGADIYYPLWDGSTYEIRFLKPVSQPTLISLGETVDIRAAVPFASGLEILEDGAVQASLTGTEINYTATGTSPGKHWIKVRGTYNGQTYADSVYYVVRGPVSQQDPPANIRPGINYLNDSTVILALYAPRKEFVYVLGDFNAWQIEGEYYMSRSLDSTLWWLQVPGLTPGQEYAFQYLIDGTLRLADAYADKVLDPGNDPFLGTVYPGLKPYPTGLTTGIVSVLQPAKPAYTWQHTTFQRPANGDLIIYELHIRDFVARHDYKTVIDTLDYLQRLGVNAIELMPVMEFEGNNSWGYNPSFFFAPDKYYGTATDLKAFIDSCHGRGIAVILDMVLNHAFSQCPLTRLYWDDANSRPSADNPWFNPEATHPFSVGYDFNHESAQTKTFVDRVLAYWVQEYHFDGYRMDLSKGFTQVNSGTNVGQWGQYDASRIALLKRMYDQLKTLDPTVYFILEHFADNTEEKELANYGMMLWGNMHGNYGEAAKGNTSNTNFQWVSYKNRGWNFPHVVGYMESHDEERLMFQNLNQGFSGPGYNVRDLSTALARMELVGAFFFTVPGPKMIWQFGELGYDVSINFNGRTGEKPIRWNYQSDFFRDKLYRVWSALLQLRAEEPVFRTSSFSMDVGGLVKRIILTDTSMNAVVCGNFDVAARNGAVNFPATGRWYEYFSGDSLEVPTTNMTLPFAAGEYRIYTDERLTTPDVSLAAGDPVLPLAIRLYPNPAVSSVQLDLDLEAAGPARVTVLDMQGRTLETLLDDAHLLPGTYTATWDLLIGGQRVVPGYYLVRVQAGEREMTRLLEIQ
ncbi:MAG: alpha-amylase family glycosyl hydrolase [Bacteroidia bacterium]|nr:alpha-amylase family glycosyl hydrolase [Bacteroidia bacterium]